jgi:putative NADH-flavin reductase
MSKVTVFGANGRVGSIVVEKLVQQGHTVRAFVHGEPRQRLADVEYMQGDVSDEATVRAALTGAEVVVSALGSWGTKEQNILTVAMGHIVPAMEAADIRRIVSLTGADAQVAGEPVSLIGRLSHFAFSRLASKIMKDGEAHLAILKSSTLDWTVVRSPVMNERGAATFVLSKKYPMPWQTIHRHAVADAMVQQVGDTQWYAQAPYIQRG